MEAWDKSLESHQLGGGETLRNGLHQPLGTDQKGRTSSLAICCTNLSCDQDAGPASMSRVLAQLSLVLLPGWLAELGFGEKGGSQYVDFEEKAPSSCHSFRWW